MAARAQDPAAGVEVSLRLAVVELPAYFLRRPGPPPDAATCAAFDSLLAGSTAAGAGEPIDYRLDAPKWQFLCHVADRGTHVLHGSTAGGITRFEPRQSSDMLPADGFEREAPYVEAGRRIVTAQTASLQPVRPVAKLEVRPADFPLTIRGFDRATTLARIEADPHGFPWVTDDEP